MVFYFRILRSYTIHTSLRTRAQIQKEFCVYAKRSWCENRTFSAGRILLLYFSSLQTEERCKMKCDNSVHTFSLTILQLQRHRQWDNGNNSSEWMKKEKLNGTSAPETPQVNTSKPNTGNESERRIH